MNCFTKRRLILSLLVLTSLTSSSGCVVVDMSRDAMKRTTSMFRPDSKDYDEGSDDDGSEWSFVGEEGRAEQKPDRNPDAWIDDLIMSPKARSIERNLGYE